MLKVLFFIGASLNPDQGYTMIANGKQECIEIGEEFSKVISEGENQPVKFTCEPIVKVEAYDNGKVSYDYHGVEINAQINCKTLTLKDLKDGKEYTVSDSPFSYEFPYIFGILEYCSK